MDRDSTPLDEHGQPINTAFCHSQNVEKALQDLLGVIQGIAADRAINAEESAFLSVWLKENSILVGNGDYLDLVELTDDILADGIITQEESDDMIGLINCILEYQTDRGFANDKQAVQRLIGICKGMASDRKLNDMEILTLQAWLRQSEIWTNNPVANRIRSKLKQVLQGGVITQAARDELLTALQSVSGSSLDDGITGGLSLTLKWDTPALSFDGAAYCFTGKMSHGTRNDCHEITKRLGGIVHNKILKGTDFLVIGDYSSRDWAHSSFGRKIEKAIEYKKQGISIAIIEERHWRAFLDM